MFTLIIYKITFRIEVSQKIFDFILKKSSLHSTRANFNNFQRCLSSQAGHLGRKSNLSLIKQRLYVRIDGIDPPKFDIYLKSLPLSPVKNGLRQRCFVQSIMISIQRFYIFAIQ